MFTQPARTPSEIRLWKLSVPLALRADVTAQKSWRNRESGIHRVWRIQTLSWYAYSSHCVRCKCSRRWRAHVAITCPLLAFLRLWRDMECFDFFEEALCVLTTQCHKIAQEFTLSRYAHIFEVKPSLAWCKRVAYRLPSHKHQKWRKKWKITAQHCIEFE